MPDQNLSDVPEVRRFTLDAQARDDALRLIESISWGDIGEDTLDSALERLMAIIPVASCFEDIGTPASDEFTITPEQIADLSATQRALYIGQLVYDFEMIWADNGASKIIHGLLRIAHESAVRRDA